MHLDYTESLLHMATMYNPVYLHCQNIAQKKVIWYKIYWKKLVKMAEEKNSPN